MPTAFWKDIGLADSADDHFSMGLLQVRSRFWDHLLKLQDQTIPSCDKERHARPMSTKSLDGFLPYNPELRHSLPSKLRRKYWDERHYQAFLVKFDKTVLHNAFKRWFSTVRDLTQEHFQDILEIAAANRNRIPDDDPQDFAYQFAGSLIDSVIKRQIYDLASDEFLLNFFKDPNTLSEKTKDKSAEMLALVRCLMWGSLRMYIMELSADAQIELAKRGWTKKAKPKLRLEPEAVPEPDKVVLPTPNELADVPALSFRDLEEPPENMSVADVVFKFFPDLKLAIRDARFYVVEEQKRASDLPWVKFPRNSIRLPMREAPRSRSTSCIGRAARLSKRRSK